MTREAGDLPWIGGEMGATRERIPALLEGIDKFGIYNRGPLKAQSLVARAVTILRRRYCEYPARTFKQLAEELGISQEYVRSIEDRALAFLRHPSRRQRVLEHWDDMPADLLLKIFGPTWLKVYGNPAYRQEAIRKVRGQS